MTPTQSLDVCRQCLEVSMQCIDVSRDVYMSRQCLVMYRHGLDLSGHC